MPKDEQRMEYGVLGEDTSTDREKLEKYSGVVDWKYLQPHYEAGVLLYVDPCLDLMQVGQAIADDDTESVKAWKKSGDLLQPSAPHALYWEDADESFRALVVTPFVLMQPAQD